jgi:hypothetical protein
MTMNIHESPFFARRIVSVFLYFLLASIIVVPMIGCGDDQGAGPESGIEEPSWILSYVSGCNGSTSGTVTPEKTDEPPLASPEAAEDCFEYLYDDSGILQITHSNLPLNCCPGTIAVDIVIEGDSITIREMEGPDSQPCDCFCLYDVIIEISGLTPGTFTIIFDELYNNGGEVLEAQIELYQGSTDRICVERDGYPWI